ncbi:unnamed protein product [Orchesella dallaii]|uniref:SCP domain-containing protein n=1 Tax=Orchesella dallaii TaxID=48710 RepID=A0ABP1S1A7_9HEXA
MKIFVRALVLQFTLIIVAGHDSKEEAGSSFHTTAVQLHNIYRAKHGAKPLKNSEDLNKRAKRCAEYYLSKMLFDMSCPFKGSTGENLYAIGGGNSSLTSGSLTQRAIEDWYSKSSNYNFKNTKVQPKAGQFTQLVWAESREVGMGVAIGNNVAVAVALYSPPGNVLGHFATNVGRLD